MKSNFKFLITTFALFLMFFNSICFATSANYETMLISDTNNYQEPTVTDSDLYITDSEYEISSTINGNLFASVDTLNINSSGIVNGNLFITADNVNIKSDITYSDSQKDELGNPAITINKSSYIYGNLFILTDKFVLDPGCEIKGDLYICATEVHIGQNSKISGNVFIYTNSLSLNGKIGGNLYANVKSFDMQYFGFIDRDLLLNAENAKINGYVNRNSIIEANNITTNDKFVNQKDFTITDADSLTFAGEIKGNAIINSKSITLKNKENDNNLTCKITGNLSYSSTKELEIPEGIVLKEISYTNYNSVGSKNTLSNILDYVLSLIGMLILAHVLYVLIHKFAPKYLDKFSNITVLGLLKYLGIGLGFLVLIPIISILLIVSNVGSILGIILLLIYIILLLIAKPMFIISVATFAKNKCAKKLNIYLYILIIDIILSLIALMPYVGFIISTLVSLIGFGMIIRRWTFLDGLFYFNLTY